MRFRIGIALAAALLLVPEPESARAAGRAEDVVGKWTVAVDSPSGSLRLDLEVAESGGRLTGKLTFLDDTLPLTKIEFEPPRLSAEVRMGERTLRARGVLDRGRLAGEWSVAGRDARGTWTAERKEARERHSVEPILGVWPLSLYLPNGVLHLTLALEQLDGRLVGTLSGDAGTISLQSIVFDGNTLRFEVHFAGEVYRFESTVADRRLVGRWLAGGAWSSPGKTTPIREGAR